MNLDTVTLWDTAQNVDAYEDECFRVLAENPITKNGYKKIGTLNIPDEYDWYNMIDHYRSLARSKGPDDLKAGTARRYQSYGYTTENADLDCISDENFPNIFQEFADSQGLTNWYYCIQVQRPGMMVPNHVDSMRSWSLKFPDLAKKMTHKQVPRFLIFLTEQETGHFFTVGSEPVTWNKGDIITFEHFTPHATANAGFRPKVVALIEGC